jgi:hypothetical protein
MSLATLRTEQPMNALARANEVRLARAQLKRDIAAGRVDPLDVVNNPADEYRTMKVHDLLLAQPYWGEYRTKNTLSRCMMSQQRTLGDLTPRQRGLLRDELR